MIIGKNLTAQLQQSVADAIAEQATLQIIGGHSKAFYGRAAHGQILSIKEHQGIVNYHSSELVMTARSGTSITEIQQVLAEQGQMMAFEPPEYQGQATLGGTIACGFSGARRAFTGSARDFVLGCQIINGKAEVLKFGGEVMKNVAGYDVSRLMVGALGTLGVILEVSLKVLPLSKHEQTLRFNLSVEPALEQMLAISSRCLPVSGLCYFNGYLSVRLSGNAQMVDDAARRLGGKKLLEADVFWKDLSDHQLEFFQQSGNLWRLSVPPATPVLDLPGETFYDWGGALRWLMTDASATEVFVAAEQAGGHATLYRSQDNNIEQVFQPLSKPLQKVHYRIKQAFDPNAVFNPFRMYQEW